MRGAPERLLDDVRLELITTRRVLCHTTGLPDWRSDNTPMRISFTPGEKWSYSGEGYSYLQWTVARVRDDVADQGDTGFEVIREIAQSDRMQRFLAVTL